MPQNAEYYRAELDYPLVMDEIARLHGVAQGPPKTTGGADDHKGKHYTLRNWGGKVTMGTGSKSRKVTVGITD